MLKKAGIVAVAAAAGLLSVSPLAFAGSKDDGHHHGGGDKQVNVNEGDDSKGLVNVSGNNVTVPIQACNNNVPVNVLGIQVPVNENDPIVPLTGALAILGGVDQDVDQDFDVDESRDCSQSGHAGDVNKQANDS